MNIRTLQYLVAVADTMHFGQAAEQCSVSQPTLSMQVKKFEEQHNVQLFERNNKQVILTDIGRSITDQARKIISECKELKFIAQSAQNPRAGKLHVGIIPTLAPYLLPKIMPTLNQKFPELKLYLSELQTDSLEQQIRAGSLDLAILALPINDNQLHIQPIFKELFYLAVNQDHPLAQRDNVSISDFANETLMLLTEGHCLRDQALKVCHIKKPASVHDFYATSLETLRQMVASGMGVTLLPELACQMNVSRTAILPFKKPQPSREIALVWRKTTSRSDLFTEIAQTISAAATCHLRQET